MIWSTEKTIIKSLIRLISRKTSSFYKKNRNRHFENMPAKENEKNIQKLTAKQTGRNSQRNSELNNMFNKVISGGLIH